MKYIASCSCGKDSLAMILTLIEKKWPLDYVLFFDAGKEFQSIYKNWEKLTEILKAHGIEFRRLTPLKSFDYLFSEKPIKTRDGSQKKRLFMVRRLYALDDHAKGEGDKPIL